KRLSWQIVLPQIGEAPSATHLRKNAKVSSSTAASPTVLARTRSTKPDSPWVRVFHSSIAANTSSLWCTANTGPCANSFKCLCVTMVPISIIRSVSGLCHVISKSIQIRLLCLSVIISSAYCTSALCVILARLITYSEPHYPAAAEHCYIATHVIILFH